MKGVRHSLQEIWAKYQSNEDRVTLQKVIRAFKGIQEKDPSDPDSFYILGGWHGEPFRGPGKSSNAASWWWGGYCNHGNVLFPTWHRAYLLRLESALQSVEGCEDVMLPFWDECFEMNNTPDPNKPAKVIPEILTMPKFLFDGEKVPIDNPLYSYKLARNTSFASPTPWDPDAAKGNTRYSKPKGYQTVRFPLSGLVGTEADKVATDKWNDQFKNADENTKILNGNVANWLLGTIHPDPDPDPKNPPKPRIPDTFAVYERYKRCLDAPNYTVFSNTTSAAQWISESATPNERESVVPLESPHNAIHLAVGGFYQQGVYNANVKEYLYANGDMGDNETASFDPIFYFHHCFIDYVLWCYQRKHGLTKRGSLSVIYDFNGTITDDQGSPVGLPPGTLLDMHTPLMPFRHPTEDRYYTSHDVTDINELEYSYGAGSLDRYVAPQKSIPVGRPGDDQSPVPSAPQPATPAIAAWKRVRGINRANIAGSFVIRTYALSADGSRRVEIGRDAVLSRLNVRGCANCQSHVEAESFVPVRRSLLEFLGAAHGGSDDDDDGGVQYVVEVQTHEGVQSKVPLKVGEGFVQKKPILEDF